MRTPIRKPGPRRYLPVTIAVVAAVVWSLVFCAMWTTSADAHHATCPTIRPPVTVKHRAAKPGQRRNITTVLNVGKRHGADRRVQYSAIITITQESGAWNLHHGDGSSLGIFQIINIHGTEAQRTNVRWSAHWYYTRAIRVRKQRPDYNAVQISHAVQRSAYPNATARWLPEARRTYARYVTACRS